MLMNTFLNYPIIIDDSVDSDAYIYNKKCMINSSTYIQMIYRTNLFNEALNIITEFTINKLIKRAEQLFRNENET